jgi:hypothetical protein
MCDEEQGKRSLFGRGTEGSKMGEEHKTNRRMKKRNGEWRWKWKKKEGGTEDTSWRLKGTI